MINCESAIAIALDASNLPFSLLLVAFAFFIFYIIDF
jgi:hypothetical protein